MRYLITFAVLAKLLLIEAALPSATARIQTSAQEKAASLRAQLSEVETRQAELQTRLQNLDEQLKPENIEKSLAGVGSLHPEDLRAQRRRQLEIERNGVQKQLDLLYTSHSRLETALAQADADAYRQSAVPATATTSTTTSPQAGAPSSEPANARRRRKKRAKKGRRPQPISAARFAG